MRNRYLFFVSVAYSYEILRPLQDEIRHRGDEVAWFIEPDCPVMLAANEKQLLSIQEAINYRPLAIFAPGNYIYDFLPGIKVSLFHGYPINKRGDKTDDHFAIRGWFDIYCTQGPSSTAPFQALEKKYRYFKIYETGWCKADTFAAEQKREQSSPEKRPVILYSATFTRDITSAPQLYETIRHIAEKNQWDWIISFHPKFTDRKTIQLYNELARIYPNVRFHESGTINARLLNQADVMLADTSSVIVEFMLLNKPVVTYRNTRPGNHLLNVTEVADIENALEMALSRPGTLMKNIRDYVSYHEKYLDGQASARILDAVTHYAQHVQGTIPKKPLNLIRKLKLRRKAGYPIFKNLFFQ